MPERWQDELKKLRREEMPDGIRERAEAGPRRELPNDGRQRLIAGLVAFAVFIAAGAFAWRAFDHAGTTGSEPTPPPTSVPGTLVLDLASHPNVPSFSISFEGAVQEGIRQGYSWCPSGSGDGQGCVSGIGDFAYYPPVTEYLPVADGTTLRVTGDAESFEVEVSDADGTPIRDAVVADGALVAPAPGRYVWNVKGTWSQGDGNAFFGLEVLPPVDQIPDVLHVTCTPDRATADGTVVRAQADGVHIAIDASADVTGADIVRGAWSDEFLSIGADAPQDGSRAIGIEPGGWGIGCYSGARGGVGASDIHTERVAGFTVVDPEDRYAEPNLNCADPYSLDRVMDLRGAGDLPSADSIREKLTGLSEGDTVREAGYGEAAAFKLGLTYVVQRNGETIARITLGAIPGGGPFTGATIEACHYAGIDAAKIDEASAPDTSVPDVAVVRCTADGTELDTPTVQVQPDGLHIDATNLARATLVDVAPDGSNSLIATDAFDGADHREVVLQVPPGPATIACRTPEEGSITGGPAEYPDLFVPIEILDPTGLYVPSELACGQADQEVIGPQQNGILEPASASYIRVNISGILPSDVVEQAGYPAPQGAPRFWRVVRDGEVLALIADPILQGRACRGSGIGGA